MTPGRILRAMACGGAVGTTGGAAAGAYHGFSRGGGTDWVYATVVCGYIGGAAGALAPVLGIPCLVGWAAAKVFPRE